jgi:hypothetical protein
MSWNTAKILPADKVFSVLIRSKAKKCMMCGKLGTGDDGIFGLQASHYFSRRKWNVRYDEENVDSVCISCHKAVHEGKKIFNESYEEFKIHQLGQRGFDLLTLRSNTRSQLGSNFWKELTTKQAEKIFKELG